MPNAFRLLIDGQLVAEDLYVQMTSLEVEESVDMPGAFELCLPVSRTTAGELAFINDSQFQPYANVAVVALAEGQPDECIFDGFVLSHKVHLENGTTNSTVRISGQDASWLMNLEEKVREWNGVTNGNVANSIFAEYGFTAAAENTSDDSSAHSEDVSTLMQRGTDLQFLRMLARRDGKQLRVACGAAPALRTGYFARPAVEGTAAVTLKVTGVEDWNADALELEWDITRPSEVAARQALLNSTEEALGDATESGLTALDERDLPAFAGRPMKVMLTAPATDAGDLGLRAKALLRDAGWFSRCEGQADLARLKKVLRAGTVVAVAGAGSVHSGNYFVWSVRHTITQDSHVMRFILMRNAVGPAPSPAGGLV